MVRKNPRQTESLPQSGKPAEAGDSESVLRGEEANAIPRELPETENAQTPPDSGADGTERGENSAVTRAKRGRYVRAGNFLHKLNPVPAVKKWRQRSSARKQNPENFAVKKILGFEGFFTLAVVLAIFVPISVKMGFGNMVNTLFNNAFQLLIDVCFYLLSVAVVIGALNSVLTEFGVIALANKALSPLMRPLYGMPGATSIAIFSVFLSDNPAVLALTDDVRYRRYFKKYQLAGLANLGTAFGMGLIVIITLTQKGFKGAGSIGLAIAMGVVGAVIGSIFSTRMMLWRSKKIYGIKEEAAPEGELKFNVMKEREIRPGGFLQRFFDSLLEGGAGGVKIGLAIIPGVLIIANVVKVLSDGCPIGGYSGAAGEGVALLPWIGQKLSPVFNFLFGFETNTAISIPITALGSAGAAVELVGEHMYTATEIAVFTSMCMFWSGFLSTRVAMMDSLGMRSLTASSIAFHLIGGIIAGFCAHWLYALFALML